MQTPSTGIDVDTSSVIKASSVQSTSEYAKVQPLSWYKTMIELEKTPVHQWPTESQGGLEIELPFTGTYRLIFRRVEHRLFGITRYVLELRHLVTNQPQPGIMVNIVLFWLRPLLTDMIKLYYGSSKYQPGGFIMGPVQKLSHWSVVQGIFSHLSPLLSM